MDGRRIPSTLIFAIQFEYIFLVALFKLISMEPRGRTGDQMDRWKERWMDEQTEGQVQVDGFMDPWADEWMNGRTEEQLDRTMDKQING